MNPVLEHNNVALARTELPLSIGIRGPRNTQKVKILHQTVACLIDKHPHAHFYVSLSFKLVMEEFGNSIEWSTFATGDFQNVHQEVYQQIVRFQMYGGSHRPQIFILDEDVFTTAGEIVRKLLLLSRVKSNNISVLSAVDTVVDRSLWVTCPFDSTLFFSATDRSFWELCQCDTTCDCPLYFSKL